MELLTDNINEVIHDTTQMISHTKHSTFAEYSIASRIKSKDASIVRKTALAMNFLYSLIFSHS